MFINLLQIILPSKSRLRDLHKTTTESSLWENYIFLGKSKNYGFDDIFTKPGEKGNLKNHVLWLKNTVFLIIKISIFICLNKLYCRIIVTIICNTMPWALTSINSWDLLQRNFVYVFRRQKWENGGPFPLFYCVTRCPKHARMVSGL